MKKFLSLVLALVMTMSLVTISAGADYTDADEVNYNEAIDVMSTIGVISGYEDGSIKPQGSLTRGAAAKIICNLVLGPTDANALKVTEAPYSDVPANSTFAGYISFCKSEGIVDGYADGTFRPGAPLTGYAFMKMLLGTLGFDSTIEGYTGTNWSVNVAKRALNLGLDDDLKGSFIGTKSINREEAMLFAFNALKCDTYGYQDKGTNITVGDMTVNTGASKADVWYGTGYKLYHDVTGGDLVANDVKDDFGRPATQWIYKGKEIDVYAKTAKETYTSGVKLKDLYNTLGLSGTPSFSYYINGIDMYAVAPVGTSITVSKSDSSMYYTGNGIVTEVYYKANGLKSIIMTESHIGKVTEVYKNSDGERCITVGGYTYKTEDFAKGDYLVFTYAAGEVQSAYKVEKQTGTVTKKVGTDKLYIDGTEYEYNESQFLSFATVAVKDKVDFYLDQYGYIVKLSKSSSTASTDDLAFSVASGYTKGTGWEKIYKTGAKKAVVVDTDSAYYYKNNIVKYSMDGELYKMETVGKYYGASTTSYATGSATLATGDSGINGGSATLNASTTFMFIDSEGNATYYTGIKNAPSFSGASVAIYCKENKTSNPAVLVVVNGGTVTTNSSNLTFLAFYSSNDQIDEGDNMKYYTYNSLVKGVIGEKVVSDATANYMANVKKNTNSTSGKVDVVAFTSFTVNSKGIATGTGATLGVDYQVADEISEISDGVIELGGTAKPVADELAVYTVSTKGEIKAADTDAIIEQTSETGYNHFTNIIYTWNSDNQIDQIILVHKNAQ